MPRIRLRRKALAQSPSPLPFALHADFGFLAQHGRAVLRRDHPKTYPPRRLQECRGAQKRHHGIPGKPQCRPQAIHLDQVGRPNPRKGRPGETSVRVTTLVGWDAKSSRSDLGCAATEIFFGKSEIRLDTKVPDGQITLADGVSLLSS